MFTDLQRLLDALRNRPPTADTRASATGLHLARSALLRSVHDCSGVHAQHLHHRIRLAGSQRELWALRADAYNVIARDHCQSIAADRIHDMGHLFDDGVVRNGSRSRWHRSGAGR
ncbi:MAG: hypothetical protein IV088_21440 [Hydrogenophaga sp.]|uniref:hypothetical protein n=1 Tax=Hydrogenophaga sp. TaxID=1904254 RepID=UPI0025C6832A|nr:hypothetical protein [Hydrogenophaga sp.]MBT9553414.1 hypothetical protein [Hydrogenophaga sp.]